MSSKHTRGPWIAGRPDMKTVVDGVPSKWIYGPEVEGGDGYLAVASGRASSDWDEVMANARLIAAAPDLLAACEAALPWVITATVGNPELDPQTARNQADAIDRLMSAIAKAKGESL